MRLRLIYLRPKPTRANLVSHLHITWIFVSHPSILDNLHIPPMSHNLFKQLPNWSTGSFAPYELPSLVCQNNALQFVSQARVLLPLLTFPIQVLVARISSQVPAAATGLHPSGLSVIFNELCN
jgi:hypothetical protein